MTTHGISDPFSSSSAVYFCNSHVCFVYSAFLMCRQHIQQFLTCTQTHSVPSNEGPFECHQEACGISWTKWDAREADGHERGPIRSHTRIKVGVYSAAWWIHTFWSHPCPEPWPLYPGTSCLQRHFPNKDFPPHFWFTTSLMFDGYCQRLFLHTAMFDDSVADRLMSVCSI